MDTSTIKTPNDALDLLAQDFPDDLPVAAGKTVEQAVSSLKSRFAEDEELAQDFRAYQGDGERFLTPRRQVRALLANCAYYTGERFEGRAALVNYVRLLRGAVRPSDLAEGDLCDALTFPLVAATYRQLLAPAVALVQPLDRSRGCVFNTERLSSSGMFTLRRRDVVAAPTYLQTEGNTAEVQEYLGQSFVAELIAALGREVAFELNLSLLNLLEHHALACPSSSPSDATAQLFAQCGCHPTHVFAGPEAFGVVARYFTEDGPVGTCWSAPFVHKVLFWGGFHARTVVLVASAPWRLEAPVAWAPYRLEVQPIDGGHEVALHHALQSVAPEFSVKFRI